MVCGIDEVGRGPLAGPVTAAAVVLHISRPAQKELLSRLADSKAMSDGKRRVVANEIKKEAPLWAIGWANHVEIDAINILKASHLAMRRALTVVLREAHLHNIDTSSLHCIVDGSTLPELAVPTSAQIRADASVPEVMAASILAKVARDDWMIRYAELDPRYGFERHKGYPTKAHRDALRDHLAGPIHRHSFRPVREHSATDDP